MTKAQVAHIRRLERLQHQARALCAALSHAALLASFDLDTPRLFRLRDLEAAARRRLRRRGAAVDRAYRAGK